jgi:hypothetical protein
MLRLLEAARAPMAEHLVRIGRPAAGPQGEARAEEEARRLEGLRLRSTLILGR